MDAQPLVDGYAYFCVDDGTFHIDFKDDNGALQRKQINAKDAETLCGMSLDELKEYIATQDIVILGEAQTYTNTAIENIKAYTDGIVSEKADAEHTHDDRYYTETEVDDKLNAKADATHTHDVSYNDLLDKPTLEGYATIEYVDTELVASIDAVKNDIAIQDVVVLHEAQTYTDTALARVSDKISTIFLPASGWTEAANVYSQVVAVSGITVNSKVDICPTPEQLVELQVDGTVMMAVNEDGIVTVYALNNKPTSDYSMQVTLTEVNEGV